VTDPDGSGPNPPVSSFMTGDNDGSFDTDPDDDAGGELGTGSDATTSSPTDPAIQGDGTGVPGDTDAATDSDDADIASIEVVDFALTKMVVTPAPYAFGDTITYNITVYNQGTVSGMNITITDYAPAGLDYINSPLVNPGWTGTSPSHQYTINQTIVPGDSIIVPINMIITSNGSTIVDYTNIAEITTVFDDDGDNITNNDVDSQPDSNPFDDAGGAVGTGSDDVIDGDGSGSNGDTDPTTDEDDNDPAVVEVVDMALKKELVTAGPYSVGDTVEFAITVYNQGNITMDSIVVNDYVPAGYTYDASGVNSAWTMAGAGLYQTTLTGGIAPNDSTTVSISLIINATSDSDDYVNVAELSSFQDEDGDDRSDDDTDSTADDMPGNDPGGEPGGDTDNTVDGENGDEDDQDPAFLDVVDFALKKTIASPSAPYGIGDTIMYDITIYNQGTVTGDEIVVYDHAPVGLTFDPSINSGWFAGSGSAGDSTIISTPILPGDSTIVSVKLIVNNNGGGVEDYTNYAEIGSVDDEDGNDISDQDQGYR